SSGPRGAADWIRARASARGVAARQSAAEDAFEVVARGGREGLAQAQSPTDAVDGVDEASLYEVVQREHDCTETLWIVADPRVVERGVHRLLAECRRGVGRQREDCAEADLRVGIGRECERCDLDA